VQNAEPQQNSQPDLVVDFVYNLPYHRTEWGQFFSTYKSQTQGQLQKYILKTTNERKLWAKEQDNPYERQRICKHLFYCTHYNEVKKEFETPAILLKHDKHFHLEHHNELRKVTTKVFKAFHKRQAVELKEVKKYYEHRKKELDVTQKEHRKQHANELVECPICSCKVVRTSIARHKKTNKKCLSLQNISLDVEEK